ncbi:FCD domain-containing protein [Mesorhizobium sp. STM 4661]|uniref:GntR family transcriptional regulator n=1 Tax=Mesorhizobium sp. STM 4661 TaxID=1297570 RepID=UPI0002BE395D|nr:FCD domain-containing protein [Mesorhizobium sp. STM 4661]CCV12133.1 putative DNA-binding transcriptional dual regulator [Mesorhizobium sp. STM 4661]
MRRHSAVQKNPEDNRQTLAEIVSENIRNDIITGIFKPGERLAMGALRQRYGISMSPLREALAGLAAEQFIDFEGHRGYQVGAMSKADLHDLTETRKLLEADIARLALRHGDEVWESNIIAAFHQLAHTERRMIEKGLRGDREWEERNAAFHGAISEACPLHWLKFLRAQIFMKAQRYRFLAWSALPGPETVAAEHREIFEATMARDETRLIRAINVHIDNVAVYARALMPN